MLPSVNIAEVGSARFLTSASDVYQATGVCINATLLYVSYIDWIYITSYVCGHDHPHESNPSATCYVAGHACVRVRVRTCVHACVRACGVSACVCIHTCITALCVRSVSCMSGKNTRSHKCKVFYVIYDKKSSGKTKNNGPLSKKQHIDRLDTIAV